MRNNILLFARDPGGTNTIIPLIEPLKEKGYTVRLFGKDTALEKYAHAGLEGMDIIGAIDEISLESIIAFLRSEQPNLIITGTSFDSTEKYIWEAAEQLEIPSFAIIDQWINYSARFTKDCVADERNNEGIQRLCVPTKIFVMDDYARQEAIEEGLDPLRIVATGHPHFQALLAKTESLSSEKIDELRSNLSISRSDIVITYASEPVSQDYADSGSDYWGFTEQTILEEIIDSLKEVSVELARPPVLVIRLHPRDSVTAYESMLSSLEGESIRVIMDRESDPLELISVSDLIIGMSSMFLIEAVIVGKPVLSVLIGLRRENPFVLSRRGIIPSIVKSEELMRELRSAIVENRVSGCSFDMIRNPIQNILEQVETYLCQI